MLMAIRYITLTVWNELELSAVMAREAQPLEEELALGMEA